MNRSEIVEIVRDAVRAEMEAMTKPISFSDEIEEVTPLLGEGAPIDSLGLVSVIVQVEASLQRGTGVAVRLLDENSVLLSDSPFRSVGGLATYAMERVAAAQSGD